MCIRDRDTTPLNSTQDMEKIGKYELVREIGRGATSTVYLGSDPFTQREVAVKIAFPGILKDPKRGRLYTCLLYTSRCV